MKVPRINNRYSREEKLRILKEIESGKISRREAARQYGMSPSGLEYWKIYFGMRKPWGKRESEQLNREYQGKDVSQEKQIEVLKLKVADLYLENEFLKKAQDSAKRQRKLGISIITDQNLSEFVEPVHSSTYRSARTSTKRSF